VFRTLLPEKGKTQGHRAEALIDADYREEAGFQVRARALLLSDEAELLRVMFKIRDLGYGDLVFNEAADIVAIEVAGRQVDAWSAVESALDVKGYELVADGFRTLFSPYWSQQNGTRRSARIFDTYEDDDAKYQVSAKVIATNDDDDGEFLQLRIWIRGRGWVTVILNEVADIVAHTVGWAEKDAWSAARAVMRRKGYEIAE
jgi:hypothetical protein